MNKDETLNALIGLGIGTIIIILGLATVCCWISFNEPFCWINSSCQIKEEEE